MILKQLIDKLLHKFVYKITERIAKNNILSLEYQMWNIASRESAEYVLKNMPKVRGFRNNLDLIKYAINNVDGDGDFLEFGVYRGNTINFISKLHNREVIGFDSFTGLPEDWRTGFEKESFNLDGKLPRVNDNVKLIKGWFKDTIPKYLKDAKQISFIHIDCDLYSSAKTILDLLGHKIKEGTIIVFDDYFCHPNWQQNEFKAFKEFIKKNKLNFEYIGYVYRNSSPVAVKIGT